MNHFMNLLILLFMLTCFSYGNISRMVHELAHGNTDFTQYRDVAYTYDQLNRLTNANDIEQGYFDEVFKYDAQGRMTVQRRDTSIAKNVGGEYAYYANTNRLKSVANGMGGTADDRITSDASNFIYDSEGNLIEDKSKKMKIFYDWRGMPVEFVREIENGDSLKLVMKYDGNGKRISKTRLRKGTGSGEWPVEHVTHYTGIGTEIRTGNSGNGNETRVVVSLPQGLGRYGVEPAHYFDSMNTSFEWYLKNHLGSTMAVYRTTGTTAGPPMLQHAYDYRSYGEKNDLTVLTDKVTENFTGKELDDEIELGYWGARYLDLMLGVWISVDPARQFTSPYLYVGNGNNPINGVDPDGMAWEYAQNSGRLTYINNNTGARTFVAYGYAGNGEGFNNAKYEGVRMTGPLPAGTYTISPMIKKHPQGKYKKYMKLTPDEDNEMYGRDLFLIHGRKAANDFDASSGCTIFDRDDRMRIANSGDNKLIVVPDALEDLDDGPGNVFVNPHEIEVEGE